MPQTEKQDFDIGKLVAEAGAEVDALIKAEKEKIEALKKAEESSSSSSESSSSSSVAKKEDSFSAAGSAEDNLMNKKEEGSSSSSESSMKKDENSSGYESQAPEASSPPPSPEDGAAPAPEEQQGEDLQSMVSSLDDQMLDELCQVVMMEQEARKQQAPQEQPPEAPQAAPQESAPMDKMAMAYKNELEKYQEKLAKSEEQANVLQKSFTAMTELLDKMINRPVSKAVTDVRSIDYIDKNDKTLKKTEGVNISDADLKKKANEIAKDHKKLGTLAKKERDALLDFLVTKKRTPEVIELVSK